MLALAPLFAVLGGSLMLELSVPVLSALVAVPGKIDPQAAMAFFMIGCGPCCADGHGDQVAGTMVSAGRSSAWPAGPGPTAREPTAAAASRRRLPRRPPDAAVDQARAPRRAPTREIRLTPPARSPPTTLGPASQRREIRAAAPPAQAGHQLDFARAGVGSRFRAAPAHDGEIEMTRLSQPSPRSACSPSPPAARRRPAPRRPPLRPRRGRAHRGRANVQATIRFGEDELIENVAIGDSQAWQVTPNKRANLLFVKPLADRARDQHDGGDQRAHLSVRPGRKPQSQAPLYVLRFTYPAKSNRRPRATLDAARRRTTSNWPRRPIRKRSSIPADLNFAWTRSGDKKLLPRGSTTTAGDLPGLAGRHPGSGDPGQGQGRRRRPGQLRGARRRDRGRRRAQ